MESRYHSRMKNIMGVLFLSDLWVPIVILWFFVCCLWRFFFIWRNRSFSAVLQREIALFRFLVCSAHTSVHDTSDVSVTWLSLNATHASILCFLYALYAASGTFKPKKNSFPHVGWHRTFYVEMWAYSLPLKLQSKHTNSHLWAI